MKKYKTKRIVFLVLIILVCFANENLAQVVNKNTPHKITIASEPDYPPFCIINKKGKAEGFSIDLFLAAAKAANIEVKVKIGIWDKIKKDLADGKIDALPLVGRTPEREQIYDFTLPYLTLHGAMFVKEGSARIKSVEELKEKKVIVMKGDNAEEFVRRNNISDHIITTNTFKEAFKELEAGGADVVIAQRIMGIYLLKEIGIKTIVPLDIPLYEFRQEFCFAVRKGNAGLLSLLNEGLSIIIANKTYDDIQQKWFGPTTEKVIDYEKMIEIVTYILIPFILILSMLSILYLRAEVKNRTKSLEKEIAAHKQTVLSLYNQQLLLNEMEKVTKVGGWDYDVETQKITWTDGVYDIHEVSRNNYDPSLKDNDIKFYHPDEQRIIDEAFNQTLNEGKSYDLVLRLITANGTLKWVRTSGYSEIRNGKIVRIYGNIMDVTAQKVLEEEQNQIEKNLRDLKDDLEKIVAERTKQLDEKIVKLRKSEKAMLYMIEDLNETTDALEAERQKLELVNRELEAYSYSVSHDLRAPLRAIDGFSKIILEKYYPQLDDEGKRLFNVISVNTQRMGAIIDDLLALSRINRSELKIQQIDMKNIVHSMYYELTDGDKRQKVILEIQDLPHTFGDTVLLRHVWANLLSNAIKFSSKSERPQIIIRGEVNENETVYSINDNGVGYDPQYAHKLFGVFQRLHSYEQFEGTGVGLAIVQRIVERHGGRVWAKSELGKGATFYFSLPHIKEEK